MTAFMLCFSVYYVSSSLKSPGLIKRKLVQLLSALTRKRNLRGRGGIYIGLIKLIFSDRNLLQQVLQVDAMRKENQ